MKANASEAHFISGIDMYDRFKEEHQQLEACYDALLEHRKTLIDTSPGSEGYSNVVFEHAVQCRTFVRLLLTFVPPSRGRLTNLLGDECCALLAHYLLEDYCKHLVYYLEKEPSQDSTGPLVVMGLSRSALVNYLEQLPKLTQQDYTDIAQNNPLKYLRDWLAEEDAGARENISSQVESVVNEESVLSPRDIVVPPVGVLAFWPRGSDEPLPEEPESGVLPFVVGSAVSTICSYVPDWTQASVEMPKDLAGYLDEFGSEIFVALDKLNPQYLPELRTTVLRIYLATFGFVTKSSSSTRLSESSRKKDSFSPHFRFDMNAVLSPLKDPTMDLKKCSLSKLCKAYKATNAITAYDECARTTDDLKIIGVSDLEGNHLPAFKTAMADYLDSVISETVLQITEAVELTAPRDNKEELEENTALKVCLEESLGEVVQRLSESDGPSCGEGSTAGYKLYYESIIKYGFMALVPHLRHPSTMSSFNFVILAHDALKQLNFINVQTGLDGPDSPASVFLTELLCRSVLTVMAFGTSPSRVSFKIYMEKYIECKLQSVLERAMAYMTPGAVTEMASIIGQIIVNVREEAGASSRITHLSDVKFHTHHLASSVSTIFFETDEALMCNVARFVTLMLKLFTCCHDSGVLACLEKLSYSGLCCCMDTNSILSIIFENLRTKRNVVQKTLDFVKNVVVENLNGYRHSAVSDCDECSYITIQLKEDHEHGLGADYVGIELEGPDFAKLSCIRKTPRNNRLLPPGEKLMYNMLKWSGLKNYLPLLEGEMFNEFIHEHLLYLVRFGRKEIQKVLFENLYAPWIRKHLTSDFCTATNLNDDSKLSALSSIFTALNLIVVTNPGIHISLSKDEWNAWSRIFKGQTGTADFNFARAAYGFACALNTAAVGKLNVALPQFRNYDFLESHGFMAVEEVIYEAQKTMCSNLKAESEPTGWRKGFDRLVLTWMTFEELSYLPSFVEYLEARFFSLQTAKDNLDPVGTLSALLKTLLGEDCSPDHPWVSNLRENCVQTFELIKAILSVVAAVPSLKNRRSEAVVKLRQLTSALVEARSPAVEPLLHALLDVNHDRIGNSMVGELDMLCSRSGQHSVGGQNCVARVIQAETLYGSLERDSDCLNQFAWPELLSVALDGLCMHHQQFLKEPIPPPVEDLSSVPEEVPSEAPSIFGSLSLGSLSSSFTYSPFAVTAPESAPESECAEEDTKIFHMSAHGVIMQQCLHKLTLVCRESNFIRRKVHQMKFMDTLLEKFSDTLRNPDDLRDVAVAVLELWSLLAQVSVTAPQLADYLSIFMGQQPPVGPLISTLQQLMEDAVSTPQHSLQFPSVAVSSFRPPTQGLSHPVDSYTCFSAFGLKKQTSQTVPSGGFWLASDNLSSEQEEFAEFRTNFFDGGSTEADSPLMESGVYQSCVSCVLPYQNDEWIPVCQPTTVAFWCKLDAVPRRRAPVDGKVPTDDEPPSRLHLFTVGVQGLMLSVFIHPDTGLCDIVFVKLVLPSKMLQLVFEESIPLAGLLDGGWHFMTLSLDGHNTRKRADVSGQISLDGSSFPWNGNMRPLGTVRQNTARFVLLGHRGRDNPADGGDQPAESSLSMTNFFMLKHKVMNPTIILLLMSFGIDAENFLSTRGEVCGQLLKKFITHDWLKSMLPPDDDREGASNAACQRNTKKTMDKIFDFLKGKLQNVLIPFNRSLVFSFNCRRPGEFMVYDNFTASSHESSNSYNHGTTHCSFVHGVLRSHHQQLVQHSLLQLGGVNQLFFLLARVVELNTVDFSEVRRAFPIYSVHDEIAGNPFAYYEDPREDPRQLMEMDQSLPDGAANLCANVPAEVPADCKPVKPEEPSQGALQAQCIRLLFWCVRNNPSLCRQYHAMEGNEMVVRLLYSTKMDTRMLVLKALLDQCSSESLIAVDQESMVLGANENNPVLGQFREPSCNVLVTDAPFLAVLFRHWHRVELAKLRDRVQAGVPYASRPERLAVDSLYGSCNSLEVLHRCASLLLGSDYDNFQYYNRLQIQAAQPMQRIIKDAQVLHLEDWNDLLISPQLMRLLLQCFLPRRQFSCLPPAILRSLLSSLVEYLVVCVEPRRALVWDSRSCVSRLVKLYKHYDSADRSVTMEKKIRDLMETEVAKEVKETIVLRDSTMKAPIADPNAGAWTQMEVEALTTKKPQSKDPPAEARSASVSPFKRVAVTPQRPVPEQQQQAPSSGRKEASVPSTGTSEVAEARDSDSPGTSSPSSGEDEELVNLEKSEPDEQPDRDTDMESGRDSPDPEPYEPKSPSEQKEMKMGEQLVTALYELLQLQENYKNFCSMVHGSLQPYRLALLAHHVSPVVRAAVIKIFCLILNKFAEAVADCDSYREMLSVVHHQLSCHSSSEELLEACYLLVVTKPPLKDQSSALAYPRLITTDLNAELRDESVRENVVHCFAPLLAVLPKVLTPSPAVLEEVILFIDTIIDHGALYNHQLLKIEHLPESLVLTLYATIKESRFKAYPIVNLVTNLTRTLLVATDELASRGFDLICKIFLVCERETGGISYGDCLRALGKVVMNSLVCLLQAMQVVSGKQLALALRENGTASGPVIDKIVADEKEKRKLFIPTNSNHEYKDDVVEFSSVFAATIENLSMNTSRYVLRTIRLLKMTNNIMLKLAGWLTPNTSNSSSSMPDASGLFPQFMLDLQLSLLSSWHSPTLAACREGFSGHQKLPPHQFEDLSKEYERHLRLTLPETLCLLAHPSSLARRRMALLQRLSDERCAHNVFVYCRDRQPQLFSVLGEYLLSLERSLENSTSHSSCTKVLSTYERVRQLPLERGPDGRLQDVVVKLMSEHLQRRATVACHEVSLDVQACMAKSIREHDAHKTVICDLYNQFLVMHCKLKRNIMEDIKDGEDTFNHMTALWRRLCSSYAGDGTPWNKHFPCWWQLNDSLNKDMTRKLVSRKLITVLPSHFTEKSIVEHVIPQIEDSTPKQEIAKITEQEPLATVLKDAVRPYGDKRVEVPRGLRTTVSPTYSVIIIEADARSTGTIYLTGGILFRGAKQMRSYKKEENDNTVSCSLFIGFKKLVGLRKMRYLLVDNALEVSLKDKSSWFIVCEDLNERNSLYGRLSSEASLPPPRPLKERLDKATKSWKSRTISNFDYLMELNFLAGRTVNDLGQYPVFPFVLKDYSSPYLDLTIQTTFRDLSKPLPAQTTQRQAIFKELYESRKTMDHMSGGHGFHYGNLYSNPAIVLTYLVRLPPFTQKFLHFQGGKFDNPSRMFRDIEDAYKKITSTTTVDFKEAIPEMYYLPEMFENVDGFNFNMVDSEPVCDEVVLPRWCEDARQFVLFHRAALESDYVTSHLHLWIDLVFGYKQGGEEAVKAVNVYHPSCYPELMSSSPDPDLWRAMRENYGQVPLQLFKESHPAAAAKRDTSQEHTSGLVQYIAPAGELLRGLRFKTFAFFDDAADARRMATTSLHRSASSADTLRPGKTLVLSGEVTTEFLAVSEGLVVVTDPAGCHHLVDVHCGDAIIRVKSPQLEKPYPISSRPAFVKVSCVTSEGSQVWVGTSSGLLLLYSISFAEMEVNRQTLDPAQPRGSFTVSCSSARQLSSHRGAVTAVACSDHYNFCVSGDDLGVCCVWDPHGAVLVRSVHCCESGVAHLLISHTSGDWIAASRGGAVPQRLFLYSINARLVAEQTSILPVDALAMTSMPEGRYINLIAVVNKKTVELFSSWDLQRIQSTNLPLPIKCLRWTRDGQYLCVLWQDGHYRILSSPSKSQKNEAPKLLELN